MTTSIVSDPQAPQSKISTVYLTGRRVIASGTVVARASDSITFYPFDNPTSTYQVHVEFVINYLLPSIINTYVSEYGIKIVFQNMESSLGVSNSAPLHVANYFGRIVFANIAYYIIGGGPEAARVVHYTFYDGGPVPLEHRAGTQG